MNRDKQLEAIEKKEISPLAKDKTFGEKRYSLIFDTAINFWVNLLAAGALTFWIKHYTKPLWEPIKVIGKEFSNFGELHTIGTEWLAKSSLLKGIKSEKTRLSRAESITNVFTLLLPGHLIMIPSVWLGAKVKAPIVKYFNRKHYGDEAMESPDLIARHHAIETEERPTLAGAVVGRLGTMACTTATARLIGSEDNWVNTLGEKMPAGAAKEAMGRFGGIDPVAGKIGEHIGTIAREIAPTSINKANAQFTKRNYSGGVNELSRFVAQDVLYTLITSAAIHPIVRIARKVLPGMTYKPTPKAGAEHEDLPKVRVPRNPLTQEIDTIDPRMIAETAADAKEKPHATVSHITNEATLTQRPQHAVTHAG